MASEDEVRRELFDLLEAGIGSRGAGLLMSYLPPTGWADLATRHDLDALRVELRGEIAEVRGEIAEVRGEIAEVRGEIAELRGEVRGQVPKLMATQIATSVGIAGTVLAAALL